MVDFVCATGCCSRRFCPLTVAYARTIHKFQGLTAGPVDNGKIPNMYEVLIVDPDEKHFEGSALGLLYTALSRATTYGDKDGLDSAIYFDGPTFKAERIRKLTYKTTSTNKREEFELARKRRYWVQHIKRQTRSTQALIQPILANGPALATWATKHRISYKQLQRRIEMYKKAKVNRKRKSY